MKPNLTHRVNPLNGKPLRPRRDRRVITIPPAPNDAREVLARNATATQRALDDYLATIADKRVLDPLRAARDGAREALAAFNQGGSAKP